MDKKEFCEFYEQLLKAQRNFSISPGNSDASVSVSFLYRGCSGISSNANRG